MEKKLISYYQQVYKIDSNLFNNATNSLQLFFHTSNNNTDELADSLEKLFMAFHREKNDEGLHSAIGYVALQLKNSLNVKVNIKVWHLNDTRADIILIDDEAQLGLVIEMIYDGSAEQALNQTGKYLKTFEKHTHIKAIKLLGINISRDVKVEIKFNLVKSPFYLEQGFTSAQ